jgi:hypothetical protein
LSLYLKAKFLRLYIRIILFLFVYSLEEMSLPAKVEEKEKE